LEDAASQTEIKLRRTASTFDRRANGLAKNTEIKLRRTASTFDRRANGLAKNTEIKLRRTWGNGINVRIGRMRFPVPTTGNDLQPVVGCQHV